MNYIDYILFGVILIGFILGYKDGLVRKLLGLAGLIAAIMLAVNYSGELGEQLAPMFKNELYLAKVISGILIFLGTILLVSILKRMIHPVDKVNKFINQFLGGLAGVIQIVFLLSVFMLLLNFLNFPDEEDQAESILYSSIYSVIPTTIEMVAGKDFQTEGFLKDYIDSKNDTKVKFESDDPVIPENNSFPNETSDPNDSSISLDSLIRR
ncbi:MAG: CvpA family protein [Ignavibacteriae bacterium]|nr:CvpA family protein [Ignavibacteriota bacterium]